MTAQSAHRSAFASSTYRRYFPGSIFSTLGSWTLRFLLGWSAWELTESATWVGAVAALSLAPALVLSPLFGIVADRINPRNGLLCTISVYGALAALAGVIVAAELLSVPALLTMALVLGVATSAHTPIRLALIPSLVPRESLPSAVGYSAVIFNTSRILGPALGAWLLTSFPMERAYFTASALVLLALPFLLSIEGRPPAERTADSEGFFRQLIGGLRYTRDSATIRLILTYCLINAMLGRTVIELLPALSGKLLGGEAATLAQLTASAGIGSILGGLLVSRMGGNEQRLFRFLAISLALSAGLVAGLSWPARVELLALGIGGISLLATVAGTTSQALAQLTVDDEYRGRVLSLWTMIVMGAPALGAIVMGGLADKWSFAPVLVIFGLAGLIAVLILRWR